LADDTFTNVFVANQYKIHHTFWTLWIGFTAVKHLVYNIYSFCFFVSAYTVFDTATIMHFGKTVKRSTGVQRFENFKCKQNQKDAEKDFIFKQPDWFPGHGMPVILAENTIIQIKTESKSLLKC